MGDTITRLRVGPVIYAWLYKIAWFALERSYAGVPTVLFADGQHYTVGPVWVPFHNYIVGHLIPIEDFAETDHCSLITDSCEPKAAR